jgi:hypothetical protein
MTTEEYKTPYHCVFEHSRLKIPRHQQIEHLHDALKNSRCVKGLFNSRKTGPHLTSFLAHYEYHILTTYGTFPETVSLESYKYACMKVHETASDGFEAYHELLRDKLGNAKTIQACEGCIFNKLSLKDTASS